MALSRIRERNYPEAGGDSRNQRLNSMVEWIQDFPPNPNRWDTECHHYHSALEGNLTTGGIGSRVNGTVRSIRYQNSTSMFNHVARNVIKPPHSLESNTALASRMRAETAPLREEWSAGTFIGELRDFPRLIKHGMDTARWLKKNALKAEDLILDRHRNPKAIGEAIRDAVPKSFGQGLDAGQKAGNSYLAYSFGVAPYLSDLATTLGWVDAVERRRKELESMRTRKEAKRRWNDCGRFEQVSNQNVLMANPGSLYANVTTVWTFRRWAIANWRMTANTGSLPSSDRDFYNMLNGLNPRNVFTVAYELMPWSWLIDYMGNVGDILKGTVNGGQFNCSITICTEWICEQSHPAVNKVDPLNSINLQVSKGSMKTRWFDRSLHSGTDLTYTGDILSPHQLSILGSLAVSRFKKSS